MNKLRMAISWMLVFCGLAMVGCESDSGPDPFQVRVENESSEAVLVFANGELLREVPPNDGARMRVDGAGAFISLQRSNGTVLLEQTIDFSGEEFVKYTVAPGGSVTATGGKQSSSNDFDAGSGQVRVRNDFMEVVFVFIDDEFRADVAPGATRRIEVTGAPHRVSLRKLEGAVLFEQTIRLEEDTFARYAIDADGTVIASGGVI
jgi:hypothetical protein